MKMMEVREEAVATDDTLPEFFKVYITLHSSQKLLIPREFVDYLNDKKSGQAKLAGPSGKTWEVELVEEGEDVYFTDGWQVFINDNMVQDGEFLFFKLHGNLMFSVTIYDESMCEKVVLFADQCIQGTYDLQEAGHEQNVVKPVKRRTAGNSQPKGSLSSLKAKRTPTSVNPSFEKSISVWSSRFKWGCSLTLPSSFVQEHSLSYKSNEKMTLQTCKNLTWKVTIVSSFGAIILRKGWTAFARENKIKAGDVCKFELLHRLKMLVHVDRQHGGRRQKKVNVADSNMSLKKPVGTCHSQLRRGSEFITEEQEMAATSAPSFVNPIFVTRIRKYHIKRTCMVHMPSWFVQENLLNYEEKEKMVLRTETDESWAVNIIKNKQNLSVYSLSGGWVAFVHDNNIKEGDTIKFEIVKRLEMKVYITHCSKQS